VIEGADTYDPDALAHKVAGKVEQIASNMPAV